MSYSTMYQKFPTILRTTELISKIESNIDLFESIKSRHNIEVNQTNHYSNEILVMLKYHSDKYQSEIKEKILDVLSKQVIPIINADKYVKVCKIYKDLLNNNSSIGETYICKIHKPTSCSSFIFDELTEKLYNDCYFIFNSTMMELSKDFSEELNNSYRKLHNLELNLKEFHKTK